MFKCHFLLEITIGNDTTTKVYHETLLVEIYNIVLFICDILFALFIQVIWPHSGHYFPTKENLFELLDFMGGNGITILMMLRYISYKSFIVYFSLYSNFHRLSCLILCIVTFFVFFLQKMDSVLMLRNKDWRKRGTITLEWQRERS